MKRILGLSVPVMATSLLAFGQTPIKKLEQENRSARKRRSAPTRNRYWGRSRTSAPPPLSRATPPTSTADRSLDTERPIQGAGHERPIPLHPGVCEARWLGVAGRRLLGDGHRRAAISRVTTVGAEDEAADLSPGEHSLTLSVPLWAQSASQC